VGRLGRERLALLSLLEAPRQQCVEIWLDDVNATNRDYSATMQKLAFRPVPAIARMEVAVGELSRRFFVRRQRASIQPSQEPPVVVRQVFAAVQLRSGNEHAGSSQDRSGRLPGLCGQVALMGPLVMIRLLVLDQRPDTKYVPSVVRDHQESQVMSGWVSPDGDQMTKDSPGPPSSLGVVAGCGWSLDSQNQRWGLRSSGSRRGQATGAARSGEDNG